MAAQSQVCDFGWKAEDFDLPGVDGRRHSLASTRGPNGLLVMFICNHCPYVQSIRPRIVRDSADFEPAYRPLLSLARQLAAVDPDAAPRAVREYLAVLDDAAFGAASDAPPKRVAPSDPAAQWTGAGGGHATFAYAANYLIDADHGVIVDASATRAIRQAETGAARAMIDRTMDRFGLYPGLDPEDPEDYEAENIFRVPPEECRAHLKAQARQSTIGQLVDDAMTGIERNKSELMGACFALGVTLSHIRPCRSVPNDLDRTGLRRRSRMDADPFELVSARSSG